MKVGSYEFIWCPPSGEVEWERRWETGLASTTRGNEEREAMRSIGLKAIAWHGQTRTLEERAELEWAVREALEIGKACAPFWGRGTPLAADCTGTTVTLANNLWGFAPTEFIFLFDQAARQWEVRAISSVAGNVLTLSGGAVARTYGAGTLAWPLIFGKLVCEEMGAGENWRGEPRLRIVETEPGLSKAESSCPVASAYLGRPVAMVEADWAKNVRKSYHFDLNEIALGFGAVKFAALQNNLVNGWEWTALLDGAAVIKAWDCFTASLPGKAGGFWLRDPQAIFRIASAPAADKVRAHDSGLAESWATDPAQHLVFVKSGAANQYAKISAVADIGGGLEEVTLDATLAGLDATWACYRLRYVRLADDVERAVCLAENRQLRSIRVAELPEEYAVVETGANPVHLYTLWMDTPGGGVLWRYTSFNANFTSNGNVFTAYALEHGEISRGIGGEHESVTIEAVRAAGSPFALLAPFPSPLPVWIKIEECTQGAPNATTMLFVGQVEAGPMSGAKMRAKANSLLDAFGGSVPNYEFGPRCKHQVFRAETCKVSLAAHQIAVLIDSISTDRMMITLSGAGLNGTNPAGFNKSTANYFAFGWMTVGSGATYQIASILKSAVVDATHQTVWLSAPLAGAAAGHSATLAPGCDLGIDTCNTKYGNRVNFGGQPRIPAKNPAINRPTAAMSGTKK